FKLTTPEGEEALGKHDLAVFPMATPLLAGPGAMTAGILLATNANGNTVLLGGVLIGLLAVMAITLGLLLLAPEVSRAMGVTAQRVLMRVVGLLLAGISVQEIFDGIRDSGLLTAAG